MVNLIIQEFSQKHFYPIKTWKVKSRTNFNPDIGEYEEYEVELWADKEITCSCMAGSYSRPCHHKKEKKEELVKEFGSIEKAIDYYKVNK